MKHDAATAAIEESETGAVTWLAASLTGARAEAAGITADAARGRLRLAEDALHTARGAKALIEDKAHYARLNVTSAEAAVRGAALRVLAAEELEALITTAALARADYVEAIAGLSFLIRNGAIPNGDIRPNQLVRGADSPPSTWREAQNADGGMTARLNALLGGAP